MAYNLAVIGVGKIAQDQHLPVIAANPDFALAAVVSSRPVNLAVPRFETAAELFRSGIELDAVALCMPPDPRFAIARAALDAGLHVLMEKPPTPTVGELDAVTAHAAEKGRILFTTWHSQYNAAVDEAKRLLAGKSISRLRVSWKEDVRHWHPNQEWIWQAGGLGVFEATILLAFHSLPREGLIGALLLFRLCYYLGPFILAVITLGLYEIVTRLSRTRVRVSGHETDP